MRSSRASLRPRRVLSPLLAALFAVACGPAITDGDDGPAHTSSGAQVTPGPGGDDAGAVVGGGSAESSAASGGTAATATSSAAGAGGAISGAGGGWSAEPPPRCAEDADCARGVCADGFCRPSPTALSIGGDVASAHACVVTSDGGLHCWGANTFGALGDGTTTTQLVPVAVQGLPGPVRGVSAGGFYGETCVITDAGAAYCWGFGQDGQLGDGARGNASFAVPVSGLSSGVAAIGVGADGACALTTAGAVVCWGEGDAGQLGDGTQHGARVPVAVTGLSTGVKALAVGDDFACALTDAGAVSCWGAYQGPRWRDALVPVAVPSLASGVVSITAGSDHACAVTAAGGVVCWGGNESGQLGDGSTTETRVPVAVVGLSSGVTAVAAGNNFTCASTTTQGLLCWGDNANGELGDGTMIESHVPVPVALGQTTVESFACGGVGACAITSAGTVVCWGENDGAQSDAPTAVMSDVPVTVPE